MTQEEKSLLLKDLCARLPYGVKAHIEHDTFYDEIEPYDGTVNTNTINDILHNEKLEVRPYLRPMSSMTEEEKEEWEGTFDSVYDYVPEADEYDDSWHDEPGIESYDWLNAHHFDYRGLIEKGLAIEAPEDMYSTNTN